MKTALTIIILQLFFQLSFSQTIVVDDSGKILTDSNFNYDAYEIIEPKSDTIRISDLGSFTLKIKHSQPIDGIYLYDFPAETYADLNGLKKPQSYEEIDTLSNEEWAKYRVLINKTEIIKSFQLKNKTIIEVQVTSNRLTHFDLYLNGNKFKRFYIRFE